VWAWGSNTSGQLGIGNTTNQLTPVQVTGLTGVRTVAGGNLFSLALKSDGSVWAWGDNHIDELGIGNTTNQLTPVQVSGLTGVTAISAQGNGNHGLALKSDGSLWGWGSNVFGQLGDGNNNPGATPIQITGLAAPVVGMSAGGSHSLALEALSSTPTPTATVTNTGTATATPTNTATATSTNTATASSTTVPASPVASTDATGQVETFSTSGSIVTTGAFFQSLGTNGRTCATCHIQSEGWSITPAQVQSVMTASQGLDPLFAAVDGTNSPNADLSTFAARQAASTMLLRKGDFRIGIGMPATTEFTLTTINDPYGYASQTELSLFRRPVPSTDLQFQSSLMWDGRETVQSMFASNTSAQNLAALTFDLTHQATDATTGHAQASATPTDAQLADMVNFELALSTAQITDNSASDLSALGATGGSVALSTQPFAIGVNDDASPGFNQNAMTLFSSWSTLTGTDSVSLARESIARGENIFNTRAFNITGVNGLNDVLNQTTISGTCSTCHDTPNVGNHSLDQEFNTGISQSTTIGKNPDFPQYTFTNSTTGETITVTDPGQALITGKWADIGKFKVPTLRGLASRAPYFHDGAGTTINDVLHSYDARFTIGFTPQERSDLANFLNAL
jgi:cytochrome c peroxidase